MVVNLENMYEAHRYLAESTELSAEDRERYNDLRDSFRKGNTENAGIAIQALCGLCTGIIIQSRSFFWTNMTRRFWKHTQTDYWDEMIATCRQLFHCTFKENSSFFRAIITGVTRIPKNSLFSDLNNLKACTVTSNDYSDCFGFTEQEVMDALKPEASTP